MTSYYNEIDPYAADWLRNLIKEGLIANGEVDTRSIVDVRPGDLSGFAQCHFFAGIGGWSYALRLAGWADDRPVWTGSCPCQPFSLAGAQKGFADEHHLWPVWRELIRERRPAKVFGEQVASATEWLRLVRGDLEAMEYAVGAMPIQAASAGADHLRDRYWFVADADSHEQGTGRGNAGEVRGVSEAQREPEHGPALSGRGSRPVELADADHAGPQRRRVLSERAGERAAGPDGVANAEGERGREVLGNVQSTASRWPNARHPAPSGEAHEWVIGADGKARRVKSGIRLLAHGIPNRVGLLRGFGNAIDPRCAAEFIGAAMTGPALTSQDCSPTKDQ